MSWSEGSRKDLILGTRPRNPKPRPLVARRVALPGRLFGKLHPQTHFVLSDAYALRYA